MFKAIKKSLSRQIADLVEEKIQLGEYAIGEKLPPEPVLGEMFGVSRNTVREAIQSLTNCGLLEIKQGDGTYVIARERLQVDLYKFMDQTTQKNVVEVRDILERSIVLSAIENRTEADLDAIRSRLEQRNHDTESIREATEADLNFHIAVAEATHNDIIVSMYRYVSSYFNEFIYEKLDESCDTQARIDEIHELLFQAIRDRDTELAMGCVNRIVAL